MRDASEYWLSLDLSSATGTIALHLKTPGAPPNLLKQSTLGGNFSQSERLLGELAVLLGEKNVPLGRVDRFLTSSGPGSFTGLRIAMATVKAFCLAGGKKIEVLSGSEARARAWAATQPCPLPWDEIFVFTHASMDRYVKAIFEVESENNLRFVSETLVTGFPTETDGSAMCLLDERTQISAVPQDDTVKAEVFPLQASHLGACLEAAASRQTLTTLEAWIALTPRYFGQTRY